MTGLMNSSDAPARESSLTQAIVAAVGAVPGITNLDTGGSAELATSGARERVQGIVVNATHDILDVEVHVCAQYSESLVLAKLADRVRSASRRSVEAPAPEGLGGLTLSSTTYALSGTRVSELSELDPQRREYVLRRVAEPSEQRQVWITSTELDLLPADHFPTSTQRFVKTARCARHRTPVAPTVIFLAALAAAPHSFPNRRSTEGIIHSDELLRRWTTGDPADCGPGPDRLRASEAARNHGSGREGDRGFPPGNQ